MADGSLHVDVFRAYDLLQSSSPSYGPSHPYVFLSCGHGLHRRSRIIPDGGANPVWNENIPIQIPDGIYVPELIVAIYDQERHGNVDGIMGIAIIDLAPVYLEKQIGPTRYKVQMCDGNQQGEVELGLKFFPKIYRGVLKLHLVEANGLAKADVLTKTDPYAIMVYGKQSSKSRVIKGAGSNVVWDESFQFEIDGDETQIFIKLFDKDRFTRDDPLGNAVVPLNKVFAERHVPPTYYKVLGKQGKAQGVVKVGLTYSPKNR